MSSPHAVVSSMAKFLKDNVSELTGGVFFGNNPFLDLKIPPRTLPFSVVSLVDASQELAFMGDDRREEMFSVQVDAYYRDHDDQIIITDRIRRAIEGAITVDEDSLNQPGIPLMGVEDRLTTADNLTYSSGQPGWFAFPAPVVRKNGTIITTGFTTNLSAGTIVFSVAQAPSDVIQATYKAGFVDFEIRSVLHFAPVEEDLISRFNAVFTLATFVHFRKTANKIY